MPQPLETGHQIMPDLGPAGSDTGGWQAHTGPIGFEDMRVIFRKEIRYALRPKAITRIRAALFESGHQPS